MFRFFVVESFGTRLNKSILPELDLFCVFFYGKDLLLFNAIELLRTELKIKVKRVILVEVIFLKLTI